MNDFHGKAYRYEVDHGGATNIVIASELDTNTPPDRQPVRPIAQTYGQGLDDNIANARLIAAAPEMYELLIFAMASLRDGDIPAQRVADRIEELLARIDGEEAEHE